MDDALWVDHDVDAVHFNLEQPACLDHFEAFVEQGGRVDGDFAAHGPRGVAEGLGWGDAGEFLGGSFSEGASAGGENEALDVGGRASFEALEDGVVFRVYGQDLNSFAACCFHDNAACHHEDFLAGDGDVLTRFDCGEGGVESGGADDCDEDQIDGGKGCEGGERFGAVEDRCGVSCERGAGGCGGFGVDERGGFGFPEANLFEEGVRAAQGREGGDAHAFGEVSGDFECALADGAGAPQDGDVALARGCYRGVHAGRVA
ncbi:MAG: hypothetical protein RIS92_2735 [Verrucomicrobiota bacterium]